MDAPGILTEITTNTSAEELGRLMVRATAPVFLLSAVASFISVLSGRLTRIVDRIRSINRIPEDAAERLFLKEDLPRLQHRARLIRRSIMLALLSGVATTLIVVFMFSGAFVGISHAWGAAMLFTAAQILFAASLVYFALELRVGFSDYDNYE